MYESLESVARGSGHQGIFSDQGWEGGTELKDEGSNKGKIWKKP